MGRGGGGAGHLDEGPCTLSLGRRRRQMQCTLAVVLARQVDKARAPAALHQQKA